MSQLNLSGVREGTVLKLSTLMSGLKGCLLLRKKGRVEIGKWKLCHRQHVPRHSEVTFLCLFTEHVALCAQIKESK